MLPNGCSFLAKGFAVVSQSKTLIFGLTCNRITEMNKEKWKVCMLNLRDGVIEMDQICKTFCSKYTSRALVVGHTQ